jgi:CDP-diacylglycerol--serine O-phosphatidyltransferase
VKRKQNPSGVYLLPNLFTTASLFAAFYSMVATLQAKYDIAIIAILIGTIADSLDGRIARLTNTQSAFGAQYDSLSDMATFGVAPALLLYGWLFNSLGKFGWLASFIYSATVALRLARFNLISEQSDKKFFQGLPCPPAAAFLCTLAWFFIEYAIPQTLPLKIFVAVVTLIVSILMVSNIDYYSFKDLDLKGKVPFVYSLIILILFAMIAANPCIVLLVGFMIFVLSGPIRLILLRRR